MTQYLEFTLTTGDIVKQGFSGNPVLSPDVIACIVKDIVGTAMFGSDGLEIGTVESARLVDDVPPENAPVEQSDPRMQAVAAEPWFTRAVLFIENAIEELKVHNITEGTVCVGTARLCLDDPLAGALAEVQHAPADGLTILRLSVPDAGALLDVSGGVAELSRKVREANPNGWLLLLPADWSFRTMQPEMAREFARNMLAFVSDDELEQIGMKRIEP